MMRHTRRITVPCRCWRLHPSPHRIWSQSLLDAASGRVRNNGWLFIWMEWNEYHPRVALHISGRSVINTQSLFAQRWPDPKTLKLGWPYDAGNYPESGIILGARRHYASELVIFGYSPCAIWMSTELPNHRYPCIPRDHTDFITVIYICYRDLMISRRLPTLPPR